MDVSKAIQPRSDQLNFDDVAIKEITAKIIAIRAGSKEQPVWLDLDGFDGRPYKPSKSMLRVLAYLWGEDGHLWVGRTLTLYGDKTVRYGGIAVGGIKIRAMSHIDCDASLMLTTSRGKKVEHKVNKFKVDPLEWFSGKAIKASPQSLETYFNATKEALANDSEKLSKATEIYNIRKSELEGADNG
jgi:hypothetical protein